MKRKVKISFDRPMDLVIELTDLQYSAAMDEDDWNEFYSMMELELEQHLFAYTGINDIRDI